VTGKVFIAIAGNIGTGKTTLTQLLSRRFGWEAHFEEVQNNPYLTDFYQDMKRWSFPLQVFFLNKRFRAHQAISAGITSAIQDRSIYEDAAIFARNLADQGLMEKRDYENYLELHAAMCQFLTPPDLMIYLKKSVPILKDRIVQRGREFEKNIPDDYLWSLNRYYDEWMENYDQGRKLIVPSDDQDFLGNPADFELLVQKILEALGQKDLFFYENLSESRLGVKTRTSFRDLGRSSDEKRPFPA
jgi:deoxyadenosine/deoxycytidine kinase